MYPESLKRLIEALCGLPGVGQKTAERYAFHVLKAPIDEAMALAYAIRDVKKNIRSCSTCCMVTERDPCAICEDATRDRGLVCIVEQPKDLYALEKVGAYRGVYHVLMGTISLLEGVEARHLTLARLEARLEGGGVREVIIATNPNLDGDSTALHLGQLLKRFGVKVTRIARGIPAGSSLEYASRAIIEDAIEGRREVGA